MKTLGNDIILNNRSVITIIIHRLHLALGKQRVVERKGLFPFFPEVKTKKEFNLLKTVSNITQSRASG